MDSFVFSEGKEDLPIRSLQELESAANIALKRSSCVTLELRMGKPPARWEKILYPLLGLKIPLEIKSLSAYRFNNQYSMIYSSDDSEWISDSGADKDELVDVRTENDEVFQLPQRSLIEFNVAIDAFKFFFSHKKRHSVISVKKAI